MTKTAWVFPGQGSQTMGMGLDLLETPIAKQRFSQAESILGWSVPEICQSQEDKLSRTLYTQPCLYVVSTILVDLLQDRGFSPDLVAGHSLGEYAALFAAGVFDFETGVQLVQQRAQLMDTADEGKMVALMGFERSQLEAEVQQISGVVLANDNHADQVVISGTSEAVDALVAAIKVKRAVPLNVSGAFHSPIVAPAAEAFEKVLEPILFQPAQVPVLTNVDPTPAIAPDILKQRLIQQMTGPVRWREISLRFLDEGIEKAVEVGPGKVLTKLIKRTCPNLALANVGSLAELPS